MNKSKQRLINLWYYYHGIKLNCTSLMKINALMLLVTVFTCISCSDPEARRPVSASSGSFFKESVERNKRLLAVEQRIIHQIIKNDPQNNYLSSNSGYSYYYNVKDNTDAQVPETGDLVSFTYDIRNLKGEPIYSKEELGVNTYKIDKQDIIEGLRSGIKLLKAGETATFLFPSQLAYGYHGDNKKIESNVAIMSRVTLISIEKERPEKQ